MIILLSILLLLPSTTPSVADPFGGLAVGAGLKILGDKVNEAVEKAIGGGLILEVQAGGQVSVAIQQARAAFDQESDKTFAQLDSNEQKALNSLSATANAFLKKTYKDIRDIENQAQGITHNLPFAPEFPQLYSFSPAYVQQGAGSVRIVLTGDFYSIARDGYDATAQIGGKIFKNSDKDSNEIDFNIPKAALKSVNNAIADNHITIVIPYRAPFLIFFHKKEYATFVIPLMALPKNVGAFNFQITTTADGTATQNVVRTGYRQDSSDDDIKCGGEHADLAVHLAYPDSGWTVIPSSVTWQVTWSEGDPQLTANCSSPTTACLCVSTEHHRFGTSGKVAFNISFAETKPVNVTNTDAKNIAIGWGETRLLELPLNASWVGSYTRFDGKVFQFNSNYDDHLVSLQQLASGISIRTAPYEALNVYVLQKALAQLGVR